MRKTLVLGFVVAVSITGCAGLQPKGKTDTEKVAYVKQYEMETLEKLKAKQPESAPALKECLGYAVLHQGVTKVPIFGAGGGFGVVYDKQDQTRTYLGISRLDIGGGWGVREFDMVVIFTDRKALDDLKDGQWTTAAGVDAAAKVGEGGAAAGDGAREWAEGVKIYTLAGSGVAATATARIVRISVKKYKVSEE